MRNDGDLPTNEQSLYVSHFGTTILHHSHRAHKPSPPTVRADLGGHLKYSRRWSGVRAGVLLGAQGAVHRGENRGGL